jgi:thiamine-monophosphate kinase
MPSGEDDLIARYFKPIAVHSGALGLADDAAVFTPPPGYDLVLTTDAIVAGVHFLPDDPAATVARKALRVNLSDLAAKGAQAAGCLMTVALPASVDAVWLQGFSDGLSADCADFGCALFGGDTVHTDGPLSVSIFAFGLVPQGKMVRRAGAQAGDRLFVTGTVGDGALGLRLLRELSAALSPAGTQYLIGRYRLPQPRVGAAETLRATASAAMDVSDGLVGDLAKLCAASGVSARIEVARIPMSDPARELLCRDPSMLEPILTGGDDYEILAAIPPARAQAFRDGVAAAGIAATEIGEIVAGDAAPQVIAPDGRALSFARASFSHF